MRMRNSRSGNRRDRVALACACVYAGALCAWTTGAQDLEIVRSQESAADEIGLLLEGVSPYLRPAFEDALNHLTADNWLERDAAESWLEETSVPDDVFAGLARTVELSSEQRHRMVAVLRDRILNRHRGAMGIRMLTVQEGVQVMEVLTNMPSWGLLKVNDIIVSIDGGMVRDNSDLERLLDPHRPGDVIQVTVRRRTANEPPVPAQPPAEDELISFEIRLTDDARFDEEEQLKRRQAREEDAQRMVALYAPRPTNSLTLPPRTGSESAEHAAITVLRSQMEAYLRADDFERTTFETQWRIMRDLLLAEAQAPGLSDDERLRRWEIHQQYIELLATVLD